MAFIEYLLEKYTDTHKFEMLCSQVMLKEGYSKINPLGGTGDKGRDAEDILYCDKEGNRTILFQFSLQKNIRAKISKTLRKIKDEGVSANELIFVFSTDPKVGERDKLKEKALIEYGLNIDIFGQRYLAIRLGSKAYRDVIAGFFGDEISQMKELYDKGELFAPDSNVPDKEKRCLINLMHYGRHPMAGDIKAQIIRQAIRGVLVSCSEKGSTLDEINQMVFDYLPAQSLAKRSAVDREIKSLTQSGELECDNGHYRLNDAESQIVEMDIAEIVAARRSLVNNVCNECGTDTTSKVGSTTIIRAIDEFLCNLFRKHGVEVANAILDPEGALETSLDPDSVDMILSVVVSNWEPILARSFRKAIKSVMSRPQGGTLQYMNALSNSYICMQLLNTDPESINVQRARTTESVAVLDTDVLLTGIVHGARRERVSKAVVEMCLKRGMTCFAFEGSVEEVVFRIKRSISLYEDLGCPTVIPEDKKGFISDIFLDSFFERLANGRVRSFDEFIKEYYEPHSEREHVEMLIEDSLNIPIESTGKHYIISQENKVDRIRDTIEKSRAEALSFKNPIMYSRDALSMVIVEQQNREMLRNKRLGRWYLVSGDKHILKAYAQNRNSFKMKPSILPVYFLELLRQCPEGGADEQSFGAILESEAMLRGAGRNYTHIIAALTRLGLQALTLPNERLIELIDIMDRADFTQWLIKLRAEKELSIPVIDEVRDALGRMLSESKSRTETIERLKEIRKQKEII